MQFGWEAKAFWVIAVIVVLAAILYAKRNRKDPPPT